MIENKTLVPDTSLLIKGRLSELIKERKIMEGSRIVIPRAVVDELQAQASRGREIGFEGLEELKKIKAVAEERKIMVEFSGERPTLEEIQLAKKGRIDALIRDVAAREKATLMTCDFVQALVGEVEGVLVEYFEHEELKKRLELESFFTANTQSVHLKVGVAPHAKRGRPGMVELVRLREKQMTEKEMRAIIDQITLKARKQEDAFFEIGKHGAMVIQLGNYRISITRPPFSDAVEVTAVRPIAKLSLKDYRLHKELEAGILRGSQGILIAGPPGSGKSTFAASVADYLSEKGKIVKTFEQPRDLQVSPEVTQYAPLEGDWEKTAEMLLLVRPDYTIFDEIRKTRDFRVFGDMRLAGVGMIGVVHSTTPVGAIQRFVGRLELGVIPHVIDTVIYIDAGKIMKVYNIGFVVKVPTGMKEADLARPVVEIRDFETGDLEYEIYTFGEENIVLPIKKQAASPLKKLANDQVLQCIRKWDPDASVEFVSEDRAVVRVSNEMIPRVIGKKGKTIESIEKELGIHISIEPKEETLKDEIAFDVHEKGPNIMIGVDQKFSGKLVDVYSGSDFLLSPVVGKGGKIRIRKRSQLGREVLRAVTRGTLRILV